MSFSKIKRKTVILERCASLFSNFVLCNTTLYAIQNTNRWIIKILFNLFYINLNMIGRIIRYIQHSRGYKSLVLWHGLKSLIDRSGLVRAHYVCGNFWIVMKLDFWTHKMGPFITYNSKKRLLSSTLFHFYFFYNSLVPHIDCLAHCNDGCFL